MHNDYREANHMGFRKKGLRDQGFRGSSENNETLRQAQGDKKRVQGFEGPNAEEKKCKSAIAQK